MSRGGAAAGSRLQTALCVVALTLLAAPLAGAASARQRLLETRVFHGDEVRERSGHTWLALFVSRRRSELRSERVSIRRAHDDVVDLSPGERTGKRVSVPGKTKPVFLVHGIGRLRPGAVRSIFHGKRSLASEPHATLRLGRRIYHLRTITPFGESMRGARLEISSGPASQVLYRLSSRGTPSEPDWELLWAGDLDGDGKLDLYVQVGDHYNLADRRLFLSSHARRGRLLGEAARLVTVGC